MASIYKDPRGRSPFWYVAYRTADRRLIRRSTKHTDRKKASEVARSVEQAEVEAARGKLHQGRVRELINEVLARTTDRPLRETTARSWFTNWLADKEAEGSLWHVPGSCNEFILAHRNVTHPRVRKNTCVYDNQSMIWSGSSIRLMIYDKSLKEVHKPGDFVRVEAQLRGHVLDEYLDQSLHRLDFEVAYRFLRRLVLQLEPAELPRVSGMVGLLAHCSRLAAPMGEVHPVDAYLDGLGKRRRGDLRRQINSYLRESRVVRWAELLPEAPPKHPPELDLPTG